MKIDLAKATSQIRILENDLEKLNYYRLKAVGC
jgi:hypothetical protein